MSYTLKIALASRGLDCMFYWRKTMVELASFVILTMRHFRSGVMVAPRHFAWSVDLSIVW